jgi:hypothetical protein
MNIDIQTMRVCMQPDWRRMIDDWVALPQAAPRRGGIDVVLRHEAQSGGDEAMVEATAHGRHLRGTGLAPTMSTALYEALDAVERGSWCARRSPGGRETVSTFGASGAPHSHPRSCRWPAGTGRCTAFA